MSVDDVPRWIERYTNAVNSDSELQARGSRYTCSFRLDIEPYVFVVHMYRGKVENVAVDEGQLSEFYSFRLAANAQTWIRLSEPVPEPMYQGIFAAQARAGLAIDGDLLVLMQHLRCFVRQHEILRLVGLPRGVYAVASDRSLSSWPSGVT